MAARHLVRIGFLAACAGEGDAHHLQKLAGRAFRASASLLPVVALHRLGDLMADGEDGDRTPSPAPGRSWRPSGRAGRPGHASPCSSTSSPSTRMLPDQRVRCSGWSRRIERRVTLLPEARLAQDAQRLAALEIEADAVDRVHGCGRGVTKVTWRSRTSRRLLMSGRPPSNGRRPATAHMASDLLPAGLGEQRLDPGRRHPRRRDQAACGSGNPDGGSIGLGRITPGSAPHGCACADPSTAGPRAAPAYRDAAGRRRSPRRGPARRSCRRYITSTRSAEILHDIEVVAD